MPVPLKIGLVGCGAISRVYLSSAAALEGFEIVACADLRAEAAQSTAADNGLEALGVDELVASPHIDAVLNLTTPDAHASISLAALAGGKHVYCEKPLATTVADGAAVLEAAGRSGLLVGSAPDTFLGGSHQTCRQLVDDGAIGEPIAATAVLMHRGHEDWHPNPDFYYKPGGGPLFDMGPYYLSALVNLIGPICDVTAMAARGFDAREVVAQPRRGELVDVEVDTHVTGAVKFAGGVVATVVMSFDISHHDLPHLQLHGTEGSLAVPDPDYFGGPVALSPGRTGRWIDQPVDRPYVAEVRGLGLADMCAASDGHRSARCSGQLAFHVLEVMAAFETSARTRQYVAVASRVQRPAALPANLPPGRFD